MASSVEFNASIVEGCTVPVYGISNMAKTAPKAKVICFAKGVAMDKDYEAASRDLRAFDTLVPVPSFKDPRA
jgi:hypothetical protein